MTDASPKRDFRQEVTDQIVAMLEKGTAPWQKPWEPGALQLPLNPTTDKNYRGGNALHLMAVASQKGYDDPRWLTYKQAQENGWQVRGGEKGAHIEFWQLGDPQSNSKDAEAEANPTWLRRVYTVFNAKQIEGIPEHRPTPRNEWEVAQTGEEILKNSAAKIVHDQNDRAFYGRSQDAIHLPPKDAFQNASDYYGTALHELAHWSGHPTRLNRQTLNESYSFGDPNYAKEELRAELASVFLAAERGIPHNPEQHAAYLESWIKALRDDKNEIFRASRDAHNAANYLLGLERAPHLRRETSEHVAEFEPGSSTVNLVEKETATENRNPTVTPTNGAEGLAPVKAEAEKILDGEVEGKRPPSLTEAERITRNELGEKARLYPADTDSGRYRGAVIGETDSHVVQKLSTQSAVAHKKNLLATAPAVGESISVVYSGGHAQLKPFKAREKAPALAR